MPHYFEYFFVDEPMTEISEAQARASGTYAVEANVGATQRYEVWLRGQLDHVVYSDAQPAPHIAELQRTADARVATSITSPIIRDGEELRYTMWYYGPGGQLNKRTDYVTAPERSVATWYDANGELGGTVERRYNEHGEQIEVVETTPEGRRIIVDD